MPKAQVLSEEFEMVAVGDLEEHPRNPRSSDMNMIVNSIENNGFFGALVVQKSTRQILVGNHRYKAAVHKGIEKVPVIWVDVDNDRALRILLADNRSNDASSYNEQALHDAMAELMRNEGSLSGTGWTQDDYSSLDSLMQQVGQLPEMGTTSLSPVMPYTPYDVPADEPKPAKAPKPKPAVKSAPASVPDVDIDDLMGDAVIDVPTKAPEKAPEEPKATQTAPVPQPEPQSNPAAPMEAPAPQAEAAPQDPPSDPPGEMMQWPMVPDEEELLPPGPEESAGPVWVTCPHCFKQHKIPGG